MYNETRIYTRTDYENCKSSAMVIVRNGLFFTAPEDVEFFETIQNPASDDEIGSIRIDVSVGVIEAFIADAVEILPLVTVYNQSQHYGGSEEGGWYYHNRIATNLAPSQVGLIVGEKEYDLNSYREGYFIQLELVKGENENTETPHYC